MSYKRYSPCLKRNIVLQLLTIYYAREYLTQSLGLLTKIVDTPPCAKKL